MDIALKKIKQDRQERRNRRKYYQTGLNTIQHVDPEETEQYCNLPLKLEDNELVVSETSTFNNTLNSRKMSLMTESMTPSNSNMNRKMDFDNFNFCDSPDLKPIKEDFSNFNEPEAAEVQKVQSFNSRIDDLIARTRSTFNDIREKVKDFDSNRSSPNKDSKEINVDKKPIEKEPLLPLNTKSGIKSSRK